MKEGIEAQRRKNTLNFDLHETSLHTLTKERPIVLSIQMSPNNYVRNITEYLVKHFSNLNLTNLPARELDNQLTEVIYYLNSDMNDSIHIIIPPEIRLNQIKEGTYIQAVEMLT